MTRYRRMAMETNVPVDLKVAARDLEQVFIDRPGAQLAEDKAVSFASTAKLAKELSIMISPSCPSAATTAAISLGVDVASG